MKRLVLALAAGVVFGAGLELSQMTNPAKVQNFLDLSATWDPSLAFVMGSALIISTISMAIGRRRERPWIADGFTWPTRQDVDGRLLGGAILFGTGWGLGGFCPGPALANLHRADGDILLFLVAMLAGVMVDRIPFTGPGRIALEPPREEVSD